MLQNSGYELSVQSVHKLHDTRSGVPQSELKKTILLFSIPGGIEPVNLLKETSKKSRLVARSIWVGIVLKNWLLERSMNNRAGWLSKADKNVYGPVNKLISRKLFQD